MHTDARTLEDGTLIEGDLCIVGAGAAGISLAMEWLGGSHRVLLLEGGGFTYEPRMQALYAGRSTGDPYQVPLEAARLHYFGGTTGHWAGWCSPLDPIDFQKRDWVPHSGWPFDRAHLDPFYARAHSYVELGPFNYDAAYHEAQDPERRRLPLDASIVQTKMWQYSPPTRFGRRYREPITESDNVHLFTNAKVTEIEANESVRSVRGLKVQTADGKTHHVRARHFVLACGSIQNARLLLCSNRQVPRGLGNEHDLVGRFFMEHLEMGGAQLMLQHPSTLPLYALRWTGARLPCGEFGLTEQTQRELGILNGTTSPQAGTFPAEMTSFFQRFSERSTAEWFRSDRSAPRSGPPPPDARRDYRLRTRAEQAPNPDSRVVLSAERDAFGMPLADLHWKLSAIDKRSIRTFYEVLAREFGRAGLGRVQLLDWVLEDDGYWPPFLSGGFHHMGTTRMHQDPKQGVVSPDGAIHSIDNLHIAGAAVYPTAGCANPTLTLIALSIRLSDRLKRLLR